MAYYFAVVVTILTSGTTFAFSNGYIHNLQAETCTQKLKMSLIPITRTSLKSMTPRSPNVEQWKAYWGSSRSDKLQKLLESLLVSYGGAWYTFNLLCFEK